MEHLALEIFDLSGTGSSYAALPANAAFTVTDTSELFGSGDVWSHSFSLNVYANAHIFGSAGDMHGSRLHDQIHGRKARLWVDGHPMFLGYLRLADEAEVDADGNVDVSFEGGQKTFEEMIEGARANQVPLMGDVMYGVALWRKRWTKLKLKMSASIVFEDGRTSLPGEVRTASGGEEVLFEADGEEDSVQEYPRMVFPRGVFVNADTGEAEEMDFVNTDYPYDDEHPYCNTALCYQRYGYDKKDAAGNLNPEYNSEPEPQRGYELMPACRVNSAPNFYVIYWIRCLMKHLGIYVEENQMTGVEDLRRLFFVNTNCAYRVPERVRNSPYDEGFTRYRFSDAGRLVAEQFIDAGATSEGFTPTYSKVLNVEESGFVAKNVDAVPSVFKDLFPPIRHLKIDITDVPYLGPEDKARYKERNGYLHEAYATSECFPDADISEVVKAIESGFGVRFLFSDDYKRVRIVLLRNVFRGREVQDVECDVISRRKAENCIRGFRMTYGDSDDTAFRYKGFADMLPHMKDLWQDNSDTHDYSQWDLNARYEEILHKVSAFNKTCYVTPVNGNAYGVKVDKDAKRYDELYPSLFEYAGYMDAEDGDCTGEENTIETVTVGFKPAITNDLNWERERSGEERLQRFALFVDDEMRPRRPDLEDGADYNSPDAVYHVERDDGVPADRKCLYDQDEDGAWAYGSMMADDGVVKPGEFAVASDMFASKEGLRVELMTSPLPSGLLPAMWNITFDIDGHVSEGYRLYLQDNYAPNDDGVAPVETHDWGITLGIMRGSGSDMGVRYEADPDDHEGNDTWEIEAGSNVTAHPDTCDNYGEPWDYNGEQEGYGDLEDRVSLKLRAEKPNPHFDRTRPEGTVEVRTKPEAAQAMTSMFTTANTNLLSRQRVPNSTMRAAGWSCPGDGYATVYSQGYGVRCGDGLVHEILWTPIRPNGSVMTETQLRAYVGSFEGRPYRQLMSLDTEHLILDIDTTEERAEILHGLQAIYYARDGEEADPVTLPGSNLRYLPITDGKLRRRGLIDRFYKEYSKWRREARIAVIEARMELAQLLTIDKTKRVRVGDITGFISRLEYEVSADGGLGIVKMEIMYI